MRTTTRALFAFTLAHVCAVATPGQNREAQDVRDAVATYLKEAFARAPQFQGREIVLDRSRVETAYYGKLQPDTRSPVSRDLAELQALAGRLGGRIAGETDLPSCRIRYKECGPLDRMAIQIGDPTFANGQAFVIYRIARAMGGTAPYIRTDQYMVRLVMSQGEWAVTTQWPANMAKLGKPTAVGRGDR
jgi:hypothetical protein